MPTGTRVRLSPVARPTEVFRQAAKSRIVTTAHGINRDGRGARALNVGLQATLDPAQCRS